MILKALIALVSVLINMIPLSLPSSGIDFSQTLGILKGYIDTSISFIYQYIISFEVVSTIFSLIIMWTSAKFMYKCFFWVIRKLPIGVQD